MRKRSILAVGILALLLTACGTTGDKSTASTNEADDTVISDVSETDDDTEIGKYEDGTYPEYSGTKLKLTVDGEEVIIAMYDNTAADALLERLPMENLSFYDLSGIEKPIEQLEEPLSLGDEEPGYDPVTGEMVIYRPWGNFTIFYGDFRYSDELVPLGKVESGLDVLSSQTEDFTGILEILDND